MSLVELSILSLGSGEESLEFLETLISSSIRCSLTTTMLHLMNSTDAVHVRFSGSPARHTGATVIGDKVKIPYSSAILLLVFLLAAIIIAILSTQL